ncbi:MAG TPA: DUF4129 domain-containing protein [Anaerolineae bacterium]|nr:DUF4129 domain-containing protein [Anaerolineae bacterium]
MIITLVGYFLIGLLLTSQGRLGVLRARWHHERTVGVERVAAQWHRYGLVVLLLIGLLAALLPFGSTFGLARLLETVIFAIARVLNTIVFLLFLLLALLWGLLGGSTRHLSTQAVPPDVVSAFPREGQRLIPDWMSGGIFWLLMGVIVVWALLAFLQGRGLRLDVSLWRRLWASLRAWWYRWRRGLNQTAGQLRRVIARRLARVEEPGDGSRSWRFFRLRTLSPREQVRYFYLAAVRRAGEHGVPRPKSQTPYEYVKALEAHWPEAEPDVEVLTQAFVEARYSQRDFQPEEAKGIQRVWQRVKAVLRQPHR